MAMEEGAATTILTDQTQLVATVNQCCVGQVFGKAPVTRQLTGRHFATVFVNFRNARMQRNVIRNCVDDRTQFNELRLINGRIELVECIAFDVRLPVDVEFVVVIFDNRCGQFTLIKQVAVCVRHLLEFSIRQNTLLNQRLRIQLIRTLVRTDDAVHDRLRCRRLVCFVMTVTAVAHEIDDDVAVKLFAVVQCQLCNEHDSFRIITVDMEDRCADHLRNVCTVRRRTCVFGIRSRKTDLVVDHDVHRATDLKTTGLRHLEQLHVHALTGKRRVTVNQDWQNLLYTIFATAVLTRTYRTCDDWVNDFQV